MHLQVTHRSDEVRGARLEAICLGLCVQCVAHVIWSAAKMQAGFCNLHIEPNPTQVFMYRDAFIIYTFLYVLTAYSV